MRIFKADAASDKENIWLRADCFYPCNGGVTMAAQNDRGGGGGAAQMVRVAEGFNFRQR